MRRLLALPAILALAACSGDVADPDDTNEQEVITTVVLSIGGAEFRWADPENDGGPVIDAISVPAGTHPVTVKFLDELESPAEDITVEVDAESDQHQVLYDGGAVLAITADDADANGLPVGLAATAVATEGTGTLRVMLRHLPEQDGAPQKVDGLQEQALTDGFEALPGEADVDVTFDVTVGP